MECVAVPQCLHSGYKLLLQLPNGVIYGGKKILEIQIWIRLSSNCSFHSFHGCRVDSVAFQLPIWKDNKHKKQNS